jgi:FKBP-type peptidyl-prolyl cis-trans isomerase FkpA/FKBP-type peptidyl-prolyl cis-trans isomerase FklB
MRLFSCLLLLSTVIGCAAASPAEEVALETEDQKTLYALGLALSQQLTAAGFSEAEVETIQAGLADGLLGREARAELRVYGPKIDAMIKTKMAALTGLEKQESQAYCESKATEEGAQKTASGAIYFEVEPGSGAAPTVTDSVKVHYHGTLRDGTVFDSSVDRGEPVTFPLSGVVPCFSEGIQMMRLGGKAKLVCPSDTAYGDRGSPPAIKPGAAINFEVELLEIVSAPDPNATP